MEQRDNFNFTRLLNDLADEKYVKFSIHDQYSPKSQVTLLPSKIHLSRSAYILALTNQPTRGSGGVS